LLLPTDISIAAVAFVPFAAAAAAPFLTRLLGNFAAPLLALVPAALLVFLASLVPMVAAGTTLHASFLWAPSYGLDLSLTVDGLSLVFALLIAGIGTIIILYSGAYLSHHVDRGRFLAFMLAFMGAMLGLVLADSLVVLYGFWELTAVMSFLLIGFDHTRKVARRAALQALVITGAGGLALLFGAVLLNRLTGAWALTAMAGQGGPIRSSALYPFAFALFAAAAFTKSAQLPFQFWLSNAMEAPTPVSAFLHSATMVQAGVYLLARLSPLLGGTSLWSTTLMLFGGATLLWGALASLRQTDLKQILAQSTIASLGLLVLLIGIGGEAAITAATVYFIAHAFYKAGLFLAVGLIDHETGVRDITALGGLRDKMALTFICVILAGLSMLGLPPALGYLAKEEIYLALPAIAWPWIVTALVLVVGNAVLGALALALIVRPFMGSLLPTPKESHEGPVLMLAGPLLLGILGMGVAVLSAWLSSNLVGPAVTAIDGHAASPHLGFTVDFASPAVWLSLLTWALSGLIFWRLDQIRTVLRRFNSDARWSFDRGYDAAMDGLVVLAAKFIQTWQHGRLRLYVAVLFLAAIAALLIPLIGLDGLPSVPAWPMLTAPEWGVAVLALIGLSAVLLAPTVLMAILALGVQGLAMALLYLLFGAPDLSFTQFMVETLSVVMFALVMVRLKLGRPQRRSVTAAIRDAVLALLGGGGVALLLLKILEKPLDDRLGTFFADNAARLAHGHNIVNVILVDFRGLDTLGEISVVMAAGIAILVLITGARFNASRRETSTPPAPAEQAAP
jgi:multicomponent Na+:H+ antiporter subunit A